jgi:hypothetical protein
VISSNPSRRYTGSPIVDACKNTRRAP